MEKSRKSFFGWALLFTLIASGIHFYLARQHYGLRYGFAENSLCNINAVMNCDAVATSAYSQFLGVPMALWGLITNGILAFFLLITWLGWTDDEKSTGRLALWISSGVAAASVVMAIISFSLMSVYCLFCISAYVLSFLGVFLTWKGMKSLDSKPYADFVPTLFQHKWLIGALIAIPVLSFGGHILVEKNIGVRDMDRYAAEFINQWKVAPEQKFDLEKGLILNPNNSAPKMTIVEFADFLCPHCKHAYPALHAFAQSHPDVKFVFKFFPLNSGCNPNPGDAVQTPGVRCQMAFVTYCEEKSRKQGWEAHHYFFDHQEDFSDQTPNESVLKSYCEARGADCSALTACTQSAETMDAIRSMAAEGTAAQISGTPTVFVNGRILRQAQLLPVLEKAYREVLAK